MTLCTLFLLVYFLFIFSCFFRLISYFLLCVQDSGGVPHHRCHQWRDVWIHGRLRYDLWRLQLEAEFPLVPGSPEGDGSTKGGQNTSCQVPKQNISSSSGAQFRLYQGNWVTEFPVCGMSLGQRVSQITHKRGHICCKLKQMLAFLNRAGNDIFDGPREDEESHFYLRIEVDRFLLCFPLMNNFLNRILI